MKRDLDLVRKILLSIEQKDEMFFSSDIDIPDYTSVQTAYHVNLLVEAGYIDSSKNTSKSMHKNYEIQAFHIRGLTYKGHDYIDAVRKATIWHKVKDNAAKAGIALTLELAKDAAEKIARQLMDIAS